MSKLMKFNIWELNESVKSDSSSLLSTLERVLGDKYGKLYIVPDFEKFTRENEPLQNSVLLATSSGVTFGINYTNNKLYSIDIWNKNDVETPSSTIYTENNSLESVMTAIMNSNTANEDSGTPDNPLVLVVVDDEDDDIESVSKDKKTKVIKAVEPKEKTEINKEAAKIPVIPSVSVDPSRNDPRMKNEYDYQDPETIFEDLKTYTRMVIAGTQPSMLITGQPGTGKTFTVESELKKAGLKKDEDYYHIKGKSTAAGMYQVLYEQNGKIIVFDDMDSIFKDPNAINILKGALDSDEVREISWITARPMKLPSGEEIPQKFDFNGKVIFISNLAQKDVDEAIKSRSFVVEIAFTPEDMIKYIESLFKVIMPYERVSTKRYALDVIKEAESKNKKVQVNIRTFLKAVKIVKSVDNKSIVDRMIIQQCSYR